MDKNPYAATQTQQQPEKPRFQWGCLLGSLLLALLIFILLFGSVWSVQRAPTPIPPVVTPTPLGTEP